MRATFGRGSTLSVAGAVLIVGVLLLVWKCATPGEQSPPGIPREFAREAGRYRLIGPRLSVTRGHARCTERVPREGIIPRIECPPPERSPKIRRAVLRAAANPAAPANLHALALADLIAARPGRTSLARTISFLQSASRLAERRAPVLADLAAAHLVRAEQAQEARDLFAALDVAEEALVLEPGNLAARFNAALALDAIGLVHEARNAWTAYLAVDSTSGWAGEARERLRRLSAPSLPPAAPGPDSPVAEFEAYAAQAALHARELGWERLLREWGQAVLDGDTTVARVRLAQAEALGEGLRARGGDLSLADAVGEVQARAPRPDDLRKLASGHRALAAARREMSDGRYVPAAAKLRTILSDPSAPAVLRGWAEIFLGNCAIYSPEVGDPLPLLQHAVAHADTARYPAMAARARWVLATAVGRRGRYQEALELLPSALVHFRRAGETEHAASIIMATAETLALLGNGAAAYDGLHQAVHELQRYGGSVQRYSLVHTLGGAVAADGLQRAALRVYDEAVTAGRQTGQPRFAGEALLVRARLRLRAGQKDVDADVRAARSLIAGMEPGFGRDWVENDLRETLALAAASSDPARADTLLDGVVEFFARRDEPPRLLPALFARAEARLAMGRLAEAEADLDRSVAVLAAQSAGTTRAELRASLLEASREVFDRTAMLHVGAERPERALEVVERSRASLAPPSRAPGGAQHPVRTPRGEVALELALIGDTLLAWTVSDAGVRLTRTTLDRVALLREIEQVRSALEVGAAGDVVLPALARLYDRLVRPVRAQLGPPGTRAMIVADGELAAIPFEALWDARQGRYLVQDHPLRFASTLSDPVAPALRRGEGEPVVLIADPAFDRGSFPDLQPLPYAAEEARALEPLYPGARLLTGPDAGAAAVQAAFRGGGIVHFAGHAVFDDARPERSYLVVARGRGQASHRLTASEIVEMDLRGLRLVVLSACQTSRGVQGRSGGFAGFAGAFLAAGAGGVVGSLWRVDDRHARVLMELFHQGYRHSGDGPEALRQAQLRMLRSPEPALRSPAAWAGFRYAGG